MAGEALTTKEVAEQLGCSRRWVAMLIKDGKLPARKFGRALLVHREDLRRYLTRLQQEERQEKDKQV